VHDAQVDDGLDVVGAKNVLELLAPDVDLGVLDVLGLVDEWPPVDAYDRSLAVKDTGEALPEAPANPRHKDGAVGGARSEARALAPSGGAAIDVCAHAVTRRCASALRDRG
jgi:hypothetical protein